MTIYIAIAPFSWGRSDKSAKDAIRFCKVNYSPTYGGKTPKVNVYKCGDGSTVNDMGGIDYIPANGKPELIGSYEGFRAANKANGA